MRSSVNPTLPQRQAFALCCISGQGVSDVCGYFISEEAAWEASGVLAGEYRVLEFNQAERMWDVMLEHLGIPKELSPSDIRQVGRWRKKLIPQANEDEIVWGYSLWARACGAFLLAAAWLFTLFEFGWLTGLLSVVVSYLCIALVFNRHHVSVANSVVRVWDGPLPLFPTQKVEHCYAAAALNFRANARFSRTHQVTVLAREEATQHVAVFGAACLALALEINQRLFPKGAAVALMSELFAQRTIPASDGRGGA